jgi:hypothetical protein
MLLRIRWFIVGVATSIGAMGYIASQARKARQKLTRRNLTNTGMRSVADLLDTAADAVNPELESR